MLELNRQKIRRKEWILGIYELVLSWILVIKSTFSWVLGILWFSRFGKKFKIFILICPFIGIYYLQLISFLKSPFSWTLSIAEKLSWSYCMSKKMLILIGDFVECFRSYILIVFLCFLWYVDFDFWFFIDLFIYLFPNPGQSLFLSSLIFIIVQFNFCVF